MNLWRRVGGVLKDRNSIFLSHLSRRTSFRIPHLDAVIIKATSHDPDRIDGKNVHRVFQWLRTSPIYLKPLLWALTVRMHKTKSWIVALKGLMLMHGIFCSNLPDVQNMGRLPFDLSNFSDHHTNPLRVWAFDSFVRSYFAYLDQKSAFLAAEFKKQGGKNKIKKTEETLMEELKRLQAMQGLIDMLLQIRPNNVYLHERLVLEAMDCVIVELFDVYSKFCKGIAGALLRIYDIGGKMEARVGLNVLQKAAIQSDNLSDYFDFCREIGVLNASQCPKMERFPEGYMQDLERIVNGVSEKEKMKEEEDYCEDNMAIVVRNCNENQQHNNESQNRLKTVITDKWEVFDDDFAAYGTEKSTFTTNPFEESYSIVPYNPPCNLVLPDLISL